MRYNDPNCNPWLYSGDETSFFFWCKEQKKKRTLDRPYGLLAPSLRGPKGANQNKACCSLLLRALVYLLPKAVCTTRWGVPWGEKEKEIFTVITNILLVMVSALCSWWKCTQKNTAHPQAHRLALRTTEAWGSQTGERLWLGEAESWETKLDPGTYLLYKNIQVVGTGLVLGRDKGIFFSFEYETYRQGAYEFKKIQMFPGVL